MTVFTVGVDQKYTTVASAVAVTKDGDTVLVQAGTYVNDFVIIAHKITMQSVGGLAIMQATAAPANGKAIFTTDNDVTIDGFGFTGAAVSDGNGAGIRYETGNLVVRNSVFWSNQEGLLGAADPNGTITIDSSEFSHNGGDDGYTHNIYIGQIASAVINNSYFHDALGGHEIKSRALKTTITNNRIFENAGDGSYNIDLPNGGVGIISGNTIEKGPNAPNFTAIHFGGEGTPYAGSSLSVTNNTVVNDNAHGILLSNAAGVPVSFTNNTVWGFTAANMFSPPARVTASGTTTLSARPTLDLSSLAPDVTAATPPPGPAATVEVTTPYLSFGITGAVTPSGHILVVGAHAQFQTLSAALLASHDGDTIQVLSGTYINDFGTVNHKVIIEGVGGIARFVQQGITNVPVGILVVNTDVTLKNLEFTGGHYGANQHEAGVAIYGGNATIVNTKLVDNDVSICAYDNPATTVSVYGSEIGNNGNYDKGTHNVTIGTIGSFTLRDSYVYGALTGHEISDHAYNSDIENNRIIDGVNAEASFLIGLGGGGNAIIRNNVLEKGVHAANGVFVLVGGEGSTYSNTNVQIDSNTLVSDMVNPDHPYTFFLNATPLAASVGPITATNNTFVGGYLGGQQVLNITAAGSKVATSAVLDTSSPVSAALAPAKTFVASGLNTLTLKLSELKGNTDAQFLVTMDGVAVGSGVVTADQALRTPNVFTYTGQWAPGRHVITISGINLTPTYANAGLAAQSLTVNGVTLDDRPYVLAAELTAGRPSIMFNVQGSNTLPIFDATYYLAHNPDVAAAGVDPLGHYLTFGWAEGRQPSAWFDSNYYLQQNPDVAAARMNPLIHYDQFGWQEGRLANPYFSAAAYTKAHPETANSGTDPLKLFMASSEATKLPSASPYLLPEAAAFDAAYYLAHNPDVAAAGVDPLTHYEEYGWHEGRDPSAAFSTSKYLGANPDVKAAGIDPFAHYVNSGAAQGRAEFAV